MSDGGITGKFDLVMSENSHGEWVRFKDVKKLIIKLTQGKVWNDVSIKPIEKEECFIMLLDGETKPALMLDGTWTKLSGYPYPFDFNKSDVIKWRYVLKHNEQITNRST